MEKCQICKQSNQFINTRSPFCSLFIEPKEKLFQTQQTKNMREWRRTRRATETLYSSHYPLQFVWVSCEFYSSLSYHRFFILLYFLFFHSLAEKYFSFIMQPTISYLYLPFFYLFILIALLFEKSRIWRKCQMDCL